MKHVGLNVAADPFMTLSLTGVNAGLVVVTADDPGMHSSQNEQDNRHYARFAKVPLLEPADSQEAYEFVAHALALSEEFDTPVLLRTTTRLSHGRGRVMPRAAVAVPQRDWERAIPKYVMVPQFARERNRLVLQRLGQAALARRPVAAERPRGGHHRLRHHRLRASPTSTPARPSPRPGSSSSGMSWPLPVQKVAQLYRSVSRVAVVEELDPFIEDQVRALGLPVVGKQALPSNGEFDQEIVFAPWSRTSAAARRPAAGGRCRRRSRSSRRRRTPEEGLPQRPPVLCPGCSHRSVFARPQPAQDGRLRRHRLLHARAPCRRSSPWTAASAWAPPSA